MAVGLLKTLLPVGKRGFLAVILVAALAGTGVLSGVLSAPRVVGVDDEFGNVTNETSANWGSVTRGRTPIRMRMRVYNPKQVPYTISEIGYEMTMNGVSVGEGTTQRPCTIPAKSEKAVRIPTLIRNQQLDEWWVSHLENDQVTDLKRRFYAKVELPTGDTIRVPLHQLTYEKQIETRIFENDSVEQANGATSPDGTRETTTDSNTGTTPAGTIDGTVTGTTDEQATTADAPAIETGGAGGTTTTDDGGLLGRLLASDARAT